MIEAKSQFLAHMSHELRTPLNAVLGFAQILQLESLSAEQRGFVHEIHRAGSHLLELITELLDLSCIESGKLPAQMEAVRVQPVAAAPEIESPAR